MWEVIIIFLIILVATLVWLILSDETIPQDKRNKIKEIICIILVLLFISGLMFEATQKITEYIFGSLLGGFIITSIIITVTTMGLSETKTKEEFDKIISKKTYILTFVVAFVIYTICRFK